MSYVSLARDRFRGRQYVAEDKGLEYLQEEAGLHDGASNSLIVLLKPDLVKDRRTISLSG
jgi:hypothetical protein